MKKLLYSLLYTAAAAILTVSLIACPVTAFAVKDVNYGTIIFHTVLTSAVFGAASVLIRRRGIYAVTVLGLTAMNLTFWVIVREPLRRSMFTLAQAPLIKLHSAYPWINPVKVSPYDVNLFLLCAALMISTLLTVSLLRFRRVLPAAIISFAAVMPCYLVNNTPPDLLPLTISAVILISLFLTRFWHRREVRLTPAVILPSAALITVTALVINAVSPAAPASIRDLANKVPGINSGSASEKSGVDFRDEVDLTELDNLDLTNEEELKIYSTCYGEIYLKDTAYSAFTGTAWQVADKAEWSDSFKDASVFGCPAFETVAHENEAPYDNLRIRELKEQAHALYPYCVKTDSGNFEGQYKKHGDSSLTLNGDGDSYSFDFYYSDFDILESYIDPVNEYSGEWQYYDFSGENEYYKYIVNAYSALLDNLTDYIGADDRLKSLKGKVNAREAAEAVKEYFDALDGSYEITDGKFPGNEDYLHWFLEKKEGWCVHYATAATLLLRQMGVPSRFVSGYKFTVSEFFDPMEEITVTQQNRHAWAEYYDEYFGWTPLDVTPGQGSALAGEPQSVSDPTSETTQPASEAVAQLTTAPQPSTSPEPSAEVKPSGNKDISEKGNKTDLTWLVDMLIILLCAALAAVAVIMRRKLILKRRADRFAVSDLNRRAVYAYRHLRRLDKHSLGVFAPQVQPLAEKAAYSRQGISEEEWQTLRHSVSEAEKRLDNSIGKIRRFWYRYGLCLY